MMGFNRRSLALVGSLLGVTAVWGWTFLIVKDALVTYPVLNFLALRFTIAALVLAPFALRGLSRRSLAIGACIGVSLGAGYLFQTAGLTQTSAANAGLLTGLFVILTPMIDRLLYGTRIARATVIAIGAGFAGTAMLTLSSGSGLQWGDMLEVLTAVAFALQIVWLGHHTQGLPSTQVAFAQMLPAATVFAMLSLISQHGGYQWPSRWVWFAIVLTGAVASALAFWIQTFVQQRMPPSRVSILLLAEPAFATLFAVWLGGEHLSPIQWAGAALIFASLLTHEIREARSQITHRREPRYSSPGLPRGGTLE